jgi:hypothetical protein
MTSALRSVTSALGVCAACYMLATASWQQVLMLFSVASIGWCLFAFMAETQGIPVPVNRAPNAQPRGKRIKGGKSAKPSLNAGLNSPLVSSREATNASVRVDRNQVLPVTQPRQQERIQRVYRFPMHELARPSMAALAD